MTQRAALLTAGLSFGLSLGLGAPWAAFAQSDLPEPSEPPPVGFAADAYVDSAGCGFLRVRVGGEPVWAPRFRMDGTQLCGLEPSFGASPGIASAEAGPRPDKGSVEGPDDASEPAEERTRPPGYYVQAGAFGLRENALGVRDAFLAQGWRAETEPAGRLTAVFAGPFAGEDEAQSALALIQRQGMPDAFVFRQD